MHKLFLRTGLIVIAPFCVILLLIGILTVHIYIQNKPTHEVLGSRTVAYAALPTSQNTLAAEITEADGRAEKIRQFLHRYGSPLEPYAGDIVAAADQYGLDHRLIPAIAMQESNLCKRIPHGSNNCWGFGIYGKQVRRFADYKEGIYTVTETLATKYKGRGLVTPNQIMTMYTPSSNGSWARSVNHFMAELE